MMKEEVEIPKGERIVSTLISLSDKQGDCLFCSKDTWRAFLRMDQTIYICSVWFLFCFVVVLETKPGLWVC